MKSCVDKAFVFMAAIAIFGGTCSSAAAVPSDVVLPKTGNMNRKLDDGIPDSISFMCALGMIAAVDAVLLEPLDPVYDDKVFDYAANQTAFDAFDNECKSFGAYTVKTTITFSADCDSGLNYAVTGVSDYVSCLAPTCAVSQDQIDAYIDEYIVPPLSSGLGIDATIATCTITKTSILYGDGPESSSFPLPDVEEKCMEDTATIFANVYEVRNDGDALNTDLCTYNKGLVVTATFEKTDSSCTESDLTNVEACIPESCLSNDDAEKAHNYLTTTFADGCDITTLSISDGDDSSGRGSGMSSFLTICSIFALTMMVGYD